MLNHLHELVVNPESNRDSRIGTFLMSRIKDKQLCFTTTEWMSDNGTSQRVAVADIRRALNKGLVTKFQLKCIWPYCLYIINAEPQTGISLDNIIPRNRDYVTRLYKAFGVETFSVEQCAEILGITPSAAYFNLNNFTECSIMDCHVIPGRASTYQFKITPEDHPECFEPTPPSTSCTSRKIASSYPMVAASA